MIKRNIKPVKFEDVELDKGTCVVDIKDCIDEYKPLLNNKEIKK